MIYFPPWLRTGPRSRSCRGMQLMSNSPSLVHELESILKVGTPRKRAQALECITALFLDGASRFNEDIVRVFDDIFVRLMDEIELTPRAELARRLAPVGNAPTGAVVRL